METRRGGSEPVEESHNFITTPKGWRTLRYPVPVPGTYTQLLYHILFSTKRRAPLISHDIADRLFPYIAGIIRAERGTLLEINGVEDHLHMLLRWRPDDALSSLMRTVKSRSSIWVHQTWPELQDFAWQEGYTAFTVSVSQEPAVRKYIQNQREHHAREDFRSELEKLLAAHGVELDPHRALE